MNKNKTFIEGYISPEPENERLTSCNFHEPIEE